MPRRSDATGVPQTCPFIDEVITYITGIRWHEGQETEADEAKLMLITLEKIRSHNGSLRDFANDEYYRACELEGEKTSLESDIKNLEWEVKSLSDEIANLELNEK